MKRPLNVMFRMLVLFSLAAVVVGGCSSKADKKRELGARRTATAVLMKLGCPFGTNLNKENLNLLLGHVEKKGVLASWSYDQAVRDFPSFKGWYRILIASNLANLQTLAQQAKDDQTPYEALGYNLDEGNNAILSETSDLVGSTQKAREIAKHYGKLLVMLPGFHLMAQHTDQYTPMAALADAWLIQTQELQKESLERYRADVQTVTGLLKAGNPDIPIFAQIALPPKDFSSQTWLDFQKDISDQVDISFFVFYSWDKVPADEVNHVIDGILTELCGG